MLASDKFGTSFTDATTVGMGFLLTWNHMPDGIYICMLCNSRTFDDMDTRMELGCRRDGRGMLS
jgi:hypothetical protein